MTTRSTSRGSASALRLVLRFALRHWGRRKWLAIFMCIAMSLATLTEIFVPLFAGRLIDAVSLGAEGKPAAVEAFLAIVALGFAMVALRHGAWSAVVPFTLSDHARCRLRGLPPGAAPLDGLAREQLRRLSGAQGHSRHVGVRRSGRCGASGPAPLAGCAVRNGGAARRPLDPARAGDGGRRPRLHRPHRHSGDQGAGPGCAALQPVGHEGERNARRRPRHQRRREGLRGRGAGG